MQTLFYITLPVFIDTKSVQKYNKLSKGASGQLSYLIKISSLLETVVSNNDGYHCLEYEVCCLIHSATPPS